MWNCKGEEMERLCLIYDTLSEYNKDMKYYLDNDWKIKYSSKNCNVSYSRCGMASYSVKNIVVVIERRKRKKTISRCTSCWRIGHEKTN